MRRLNTPLFGQSELEIGASFSKHEIPFCFIHGETETGLYFNALIIFYGIYTN